jgi:lysophospholipase L1-like esterase
MQQVLVYADSLSWGIIPTTRERPRFEQRWPGVLEAELIKLGRSVRVLKDSVVENSGSGLPLIDMGHPGIHSLGCLFGAVIG